ncbi:MAG: D-alanyl-D-alanine carboxypeptidase [Turicibacter sp.]|nr:D-alanyl-D-alanine carboxypeptidase [Turicibacter sp.]
MTKRNFIVVALLFAALGAALIVQTNRVSANTPSVTARGAVVMDFASGNVIFQQNADEMLAPASMTKMMTAYIVFEEIEAGRLHMNTQIPISANARAFSNTRPQGSSLVPLPAASYSVETLLKLLALPSSNAACVALAEYISGSEEAFVVRMNETAARMGMRAEFENSHGGFVHFSTAMSIAILTRNFIERFPEILEITRLRSMTVGGVTYNNTNTLIREGFPGADGFKTGSGPVAMYALVATAERDGVRIITVVMRSTSRDNSFSDSRRLLNYGFSEISRLSGVSEAVEYHIEVPTAIRVNSDFTINARLISPNTNFAFNGEWRINGTTVKTYLGEQNVETLTLQHHFPPLTAIPGSTVQVQLILNLLGNERREWTAIVPISTQPPAPFRNMSGHFAENAVEEFFNMGIITPTVRNGEAYFDTTTPLTLDRTINVLGGLAERRGIVIPQGINRYYNWALSNNILVGNLRTMPVSQTLTRGEISTILFFFSAVAGIELTTLNAPNPFQDENEFGMHASAIRSLFSSGIVSGVSETIFAPQDLAQEITLYVLLHRLIDPTLRTPRLPALTVIDW